MSQPNLKNYCYKNLPRLLIKLDKIVACFCLLSFYFWENEAWKSEGKLAIRGFFKRKFLTRVLEGRVSSQFIGGNKTRGSLCWPDVHPGTRGSSRTRKSWLPVHPAWECWSNLVNITHHKFTKRLSENASFQTCPNIKI